MPVAADAMAGDHDTRVTGKSRRGAGRTVRPVAQAGEGR